ncbi:hypothetical protein QNI23_001250 [Bermanella sp. WJH001]|uniref:hypothetical protein n=1 Tax=Bermanella sp. WJH001 TaxID=3048005 RepID=UPI0024BE1EFA|nr:hypothetical protein [Bermanella sp. WJH001]MDJ1538618.1 hypothetical protein [Bermanella sp. WJH001]
MNNRNLILTFIALFLTACTSIQPIFSKTGDITLSPLKENCPIKVYTAQPKHEFDEIGIIDLHCGANGCPVESAIASGVKKIVSKKVCKAGGNAILLWEANGHGVYTKATVIKTKS